MYLCAFKLVLLFACNFSREWQCKFNLYLLYFHTCIFMYYYYTYVYVVCVCRCHVLNYIGCILYGLVLEQRSMHIGIYKCYVV